MAPIALLTPHHDPHGAPLRLVNRLYDFGRLVHKCDSTRDMIECLHISHLFPRHGHIFQQLKDRVGNIFESAQVDSLVLTEALGRHVSMILNYFSIKQAKLAETYNYLP